mmetsp:Transcript_130151/g.417668  ORF Transcript_130151/g.417668 Transcript_130151/m.417668 type:complete len:319 (+) Transcript_130151:228-1184(+)
MHHRRATAPVHRDLGLRRHEWRARLPDREGLARLQQGVEHLGSFQAHRTLQGRARLLVLAQELLHCGSLRSLEGDDDGTRTRLQQGHGGLHERRELIHLSIEKDTEGLEGQLRGVHPAVVLTHFDLPDDLREVECGPIFSELLLLCQHSLSNAKPHNGVIILAKLPHDPRHFSRGCGAQPFAEWHAGRRVHPQVEWAIFHDREATVLLVNLWRREANVDHNAREALALEHIANVSEWAMHDPEARILLLQLSADSDGVGIYIERDEPSAWREPLQDLCGMPAATEGSVHVNSWESRREQGIQGLLQQHRDVPCSQLWL